MMRSGVCATTGRLLYVWDHCLQSIRKCLTTRIGTRVLRRHYGSDVPPMQDQNADAGTIMQLYLAIVEALDDPDCGEPGFSLQKIDMVQYGRPGKFVFVLSGVWYPRGHLGDWSIHEAAETTWPEV